MPGRFSIAAANLRSQLTHSSFVIVCMMCCICIMKRIKILASLTLCLGLTACPDNRGSGSGGGGFESCLTGQATYRTGDEWSLNSQFNGNTDLAQSFQLIQDASVSKVELFLLRSGFPNGQLTLAITQDSGGAPSTNLGSATFTVTSNSATSTSNLLTTPTRAAFNYSPAVSLVANTTYWLRLSGSYGQSQETTIVKWVGSSNNPYSRGNASKLQVTTLNWFALANQDMTFLINCQ